VSLYRQPSRFTRRTLAIVGAGALAAGLGVGYAVGHSSAPNPSLADNLSSLRSDLDPAQHGLELSRTEYAQGVKGRRVVAPTEYQAARSDVQRAEHAVAGARSDLRALDPRAAAALDRAVGALSDAIAAKEPPARVDELSKQASTVLRAAVRSGES
jgi:hypothetical protein